MQVVSRNWNRRGKAALLIHLKLVTSGAVRY